MKALLGGLLQAIGILIGGTAGLCTAFAGPMLVIYASETVSGLFSALMVVGTMCGIPMAIGWGLFRLGKRIAE